MTERPKHFSYVGTISEDRNLLAMTECVHALGDPEARLRLAGNLRKILNHIRTLLTVLLAVIATALSATVLIRTKNRRPVQAEMA